MSKQHQKLLKSFQKALNSEDIKALRNVLKQKEKKLNIPIKDHEGNEPIHFAVEKNNVPIFNVILEMSQNINCANKNGETPLHLSSQKSCFEIMKLLVENGANVDVKNNIGKTPLHDCVKVGNIQGIQYLAVNRANLDTVDNDGRNLIHECVLSNNCEVLKYLFSLGININVKDKDGNSPLHMSVLNDYLEITKSLVHVGAELNCKNNLEKTPIMMAKDGKSKKYLQECIEKIPKMNNSRMVITESIQEKKSFKEEHREKIRRMRKNKEKTYEMSEVISNFGGTEEKNIFKDEVESQPKELTDIAKFMKKELSKVLSLYTGKSKEEDLKNENILLKKEIEKIKREKSEYQKLSEKRAIANQKLTEENEKLRNSLKSIKIGLKTQFESMVQLLEQEIDNEN